MCLVIDTNVFHSVFNPDAEKYAQFEPVRKWLTHGNGKMIYGGRRYNKELRGGKFQSIVAELSR